MIQILKQNKQLETKKNKRIKRNKILLVNKRKSALIVIARLAPGVDAHL